MKLISGFSVELHSGDTNISSESVLGNLLYVFPPHFLQKENLLYYFITVKDRFISHRTKF
jgi:hypothetical protein